MRKHFTLHMKCKWVYGSQCAVAVTFIIWFSIENWSNRMMTTLKYFCHFSPVLILVPFFLFYFCFCFYSSFSSLIYLRCDNSSIVHIGGWHTTRKHESMKESSFPFFSFSSSSSFFHQHSSDHFNIQLISFATFVKEKEFFFLLPKPIHGFVSLL